MSASQIVFEFYDSGLACITCGVVTSDSHHVSLHSVAVGVLASLLRLIHQDEHQALEHSQSSSPNPQLSVYNKLVLLGPSCAVSITCSPAFRLLDLCNRASYFPSAIISASDTSSIMGQYPPPST